MNEPDLTFTCALCQVPTKGLSYWTGNAGPYCGKCRPLVTPRPEPRPDKSKKNPP